MAASASSRLCNFPIRRATGEVVGPHRRAQQTGELPRNGGVASGEHREQERQRLDQVRCVPHEDAALTQRLVDEFDVALLQVAQPSMDHLGRFRGRSRCEVVAFDAADLQPPGRSVEGATTAGHAAADHQHVQDVALHPCDGGGAVEPAGRHRWTPWAGNSVVIRGDIVGVGAGMSPIGSSGRRGSPGRGVLRCDSDIRFGQLSHRAAIVADHCLCRRPGALMT